MHDGGIGLNGHRTPSPVVSNSDTHQMATMETKLDPWCVLVSETVLGMGFEMDAWLCHCAYRVSACRLTVNLAEHLRHRSHMLIEHRQLEWRVHHACSVHGVRGACGRCTGRVHACGMSAFGDTPSRMPESAAAMVGCPGGFQGH